VRFLVHFLGDVTQPLHDETLALGGNNIKVTYQGFSDNLHADWDTYMRHLGLVDNSELDGHAFLPAPRPMSKVELARAAAGYGCGCGHEH
jgi:hypothetical protein